MMELKDWLELYKKKTNEKAGLSNDGFRFFFLKDKGFIRLKFDSETKTIMIKETCGDGKYWHRFAKDVAKELGADKLAVFVCRHIRAYIRLFGGKITDEHDNQLFGTTDDGRFEAYPYNNTTYLVIQYLYTMK